MDQAYDFVIVGAGSDRSLRVSMPSAFTYAMDHTSFDWGLIAEAEPHLDQRVIHHPRGRVLGGSSSINAMGFTRGHPEDFEGWAGNHLPSWRDSTISGYRQFLPICRAPAGLDSGR